MPEGGAILQNASGERQYFYADEIQGALAEGWSVDPGAAAVAVADDSGVVGTVSPEALSQLDSAGLRAAGAQESQAASLAELERQTYDTFGNELLSLGAGALRGATLGTSDVALQALGADREQLEALRRVNPTISTIGEVGGAVLPAFALGGAGAAGSLARATPAGLSMRAAQAFAGGRGLAPTVARGAIEGAAFGAGAGVSELALSDDPLTAERIASTLSSGALYGAAIGGAAGAAAKGLEAGLSKAGDVLRRRSAAGAVDDLDDLASLDRKGLRAAKDTEFERIKADRATRGEGLVDDLRGHKQALDDANLWPLTKGAEKGSVLAQVGGRNKGAFRALRKIFDTPKILATRPSTARSTLQKVEQSLLDIQAEAPAIRKVLEAEGRTAGTRAKALDSIDDLLKQNRRLQDEVADLTMPLRDVKTPRLTQIDEAFDTLTERGAEGIIEKSTKGVLFGGAMGVAGAVLPAVAAVPAAAMVADKVANLVFGRAGQAVAKGTARLAKAMEKAVAVTKKVAPRLPTASAQGLSSLRYGPKPEQKGKQAPSSSKGASDFRARAQEITSQTMMGPEGPQVTPTARRQIAERLEPVASMDPLLADQMETLAANRLAFLASKLPRPPGLGVTIGPETWEPSPLEIAKFARYAAAVEDPVAVVERIASGTLTTSDVEALRAVYPGIYESIRMNIHASLAELRQSLPYERQLMLSLFFDVPVAPSFEPLIAQQLQGNFANESGGGFEAPQVQPNFGKLGSTAKESATPAQEYAR